MVDDPTLFVINRMQEVLEELKVKVKRYNLRESKNLIATLPQTLKDADAIILATTVEWYGIGGAMQEFLDSCWLYGDKSKISKIYMFPVVMSRAYGEKEAEMALVNSWEILGGKTASGLRAYIDEDAGFEFTQEYVNIIEKVAENVYRAVSQKLTVLPSSSTAIKKNLIKETLQLTPQENEQLSKFVSDDNFVAKQKQDIEELAGLFKEMMDDDRRGGDDYYALTLKSHFMGKKGFKSTYTLIISDKQKNVNIEISGHDIQVEVGERKESEVIGKLKQSTFDDIVNGRLTFQRAFMSGEMTAKGNFKTLRMLDEIFSFS